MIILGLILLVVGFLLGGGLVFLVLGRTGRAVGGRKVWY
jgi:hypothetical protein